MQSTTPFSQFLCELIPLLILLALGACGDSKSSDNSNGETTQDGLGTATSSEDIGVTTFEDLGVEPDVEEPPGVTPPLGCTAPADLAQDPLTLLDNGDTGIELTDKGNHMLDIEVDPETGIIYVGGQPGLSSWKMMGGKLSILSVIKNKQEHIALLGDGYVAMSNRGGSGIGMSTMQVGTVALVDARDPSNLKTHGHLLLKDAAGMSAGVDRIYVVSHDGQLHVFDVSQMKNDPFDDAFFVVTSSVTGLGNPWEIAIQGDYGYVADNSEGIAVVSFSQPDAPIIGAKVKTVGGAQDVVIDGNFLYVAVGSSGIEAFSLEDPQNPVFISTLAVDGSVISVSASNALVWGTTQESVVVFDVSDAVAPVPLGVEDTPSWAMHVFAKGNRAYVADWRSVNVYEMDTSITAPDADPSLSELYFLSGKTEASLMLTNRGGAELVVSGMDTGDERLAVTVGRLSLAPGESTTVKLTFNDDGQPLNTQLCIATNDPDEAIQNVNVSSFSSGSSVLIGQTAPDFVLQDVVTGAYYTLSDQIGRPVVLLFFATW